MTAATEAQQRLAHWRYRLGAIERELVDLNTRRRRLENASTSLRHTQTYGMTDVADVREIASSRTRFDDWADKLTPAIEYNHYLREEARYQIELHKVVLD